MVFRLTGAALVAAGIASLALASCATPFEGLESWEEEEPEIGEDVHPVTNAQLGDLPSFVVRLIFLDSGGTCTGMTLDNHWLLTAAHCVFDSVAEFGVFEPGRLTIRYKANGQSGGLESYTSGDASYFIHPSYSGDEGDLDDDIALIRLHGAGMSYTGHVRIMAESESCYYPFQIGSPKITGYGFGTDPGDAEGCPSTGAGWKRTGGFGVIPNCDSASGWRPGSPFLTRVSVGSGSRIACRGDSGGPIYWRYGGLDVTAAVYVANHYSPLGDSQIGTSIRPKLNWIIDTSAAQGLPLDCQPYDSDSGPDWWSCRQ